MAGTSPAARPAVRHDASEVPTAVGPDHNAAEMALDDRCHRADRVYVVASVGEVGTVATVDPAAVDEQRFVSIVEGVQPLIG